MVGGKIVEKLEYIIEDSTIAEVLGVQNFTNEESAVLELVKNAYDAQAKKVTIVIAVDSMIIHDDGIGMDRQKILEAWMHVGKSDKDYLVGEKKEQRVLAGSKGVGRFAIARLGARAQVYSKMAGRRPILWTTDWNTNTLEEGQEEYEQGTKIKIEALRDNWTAARVRNLRHFLSRTYNDDSMEIFVEYKGEVQEVKRYFKEFRLGIHCVSVIRLAYHEKKQALECLIESDEFKEQANRFCPDMDLKEQKTVLDMAEELTGLRAEIAEGADEEEWRALLAEVGDFTAELYFSLKNPSSSDAEKFFYKHRMLEERYDMGVILYRNAFSISSHDGEKDWLEFGKRSRKSPVAASHPTGAWRVRENQMAGRVMIDKRRNSSLSDLMNRQGLVENDVYKLFVAIIIAGIGCFERYRQSIIRSIARKNGTLTEKKPKMVAEIIKNPSNLSGLSAKETEQFVSELVRITEENKESRKRINETENKYQYDIRLLNVLATSGLKATSIAHEMHNDRNSIDQNIDYIIKALKKYGLWEVLSDQENRRYIYRDIPALLDKNRRINRKIITFMDVMLSETEKKQFEPEDIDIYRLLTEIKNVWERDYSWINIQLKIEEGFVYRSAQDVFRVIFDNLILNSIQQNDEENILEIQIVIEQKGKYLHALYRDAGKGLPPKFKLDPMRILEVHETSRTDGHGIGMWMVNNTITNTGGEIKEINGLEGFHIEFMLGGKV